MSRTLSTSVTPFTIVDADGMPLCHTVPTPGKSHRKAAAPSRRSIVRDGFLAMLVAAGHVADNGAWLTVSGEWFMPAGDAPSLPRDAVAERGHVVADENGGAFCPCNLVPQNGAENAAQGDANMLPMTFASDPREAWVTVARNYMTKSKASRAVNLTD